MAILDDIITKENRPGLIGSPLEAGSVHMIYLKNDSFFRCARGVADWKVGARIKASKATTFAELREAVDQCLKATERRLDRVYAEYGIRDFTS